MNTKSYYREYFGNVQRYVKIAVILRELGESKSNFSRFMQDNHYDHYMSIDKLERIRQHTERVLSNLT